MIFEGLINMENVDVLVAENYAEIMGAVDALNNQGTNSAAGDSQPVSHYADLADIENNLAEAYAAGKRLIALDAEYESVVADHDDFLDSVVNPDNVKEQYPTSVSPILLNVASGEAVQSMNNGEPVFTQILVFTPIVDIEEVGNNFDKYARAIKTLEKSKANYGK